MEHLDIVIWIIGYSISVEVGKVSDSYVAKNNGERYTPKGISDASISIFIIVLALLIIF